MSKLTFRGVTIEYPDLRRKESSVFVRLHCSAELSDQITETMEWGQVPPSVTNAKLEGGLTADKIIITPTDKKMKDFEMELQCSSVEDFALVRKQEGESVTTRLRFTCMIEQQASIVYIENWMRSVGEAPAALVVSYIEQTKLSLEESEKEAKPERKRGKDAAAGE